MSATLSTTEDQNFDAVWGFVDSIVGPDITVIRGFQNMTPTPIGNYVVISAGVKERQNAIVRSYDAAAGVVNNERDTVYWYQVDCYGPKGPDLADIISVAWATLWACDNLAGGPVTPLHADAPQQLNIINGEFNYEQRFMTKLYAQVNTVVALPQDFFTEATVVVNPPADLI